MRFLKQKTLSKYSPSDQTLFANQYGRAVMEITGGLRIPKGTTAQRPQLSGVRTTGGANGFIRYNTTTNSIEAYIDNVWEVVRAPGATAITKQTIEGANGIETKGKTKGKNLGDSGPTVATQKSGKASKGVTGEAMRAVGRNMARANYQK
jgi:hypothetical protein